MAARLGTDKNQADQDHGQEPQSAADAVGQEAEPQTKSKGKRDDSCGQTDEHPKGQHPDQHVPVRRLGKICSTQFKPCITTGQLSPLTEVDVQ